MDPPNDDHLHETFAQLARGQLDALEVLFGQWQRGLCNYAYALTHSQQDAEDAVAEAMLGLVKQGRKLGAVRNPKAYLFAAVRHAAFRHGRAVGAGERVEAADAQAEAPDASQTLAVKDALMALPDAQREAVTLKVYGRLTFAEIAEVAGVSANTAASRYRYAVQKLRQTLGDTDDG